MDTIKDRKFKDITEADEIKKKYQECPEELYKHGDNNLDIDDVVVTYVKPDILEHEVKWALGSITKSKASGVMEFQLSCLKYPKE